MSHRDSESLHHLLFTSQVPFFIPTVSNFEHKFVKVFVLLANISTPPFEKDADLGFSVLTKPDYYKKNWAENLRAIKGLCPEKSLTVDLFYLNKIRAKTSFAEHFCSVWLLLKKKSFICSSHSRHDVYFPTNT